MKLYDTQIKGVLNLLATEARQTLTIDEDKWPDVGKQNLVLRDEMAYELGAGKLPAVSFLGVTSSKTLISSDAVFLYGQDLSQITSDTPYARITLLQIDDSLLVNDEAIYDTLRILSNTRYGVNPKGYMSRISTRNHHEPVRVSKRALSEGLSFGKVGRLYLDAFKSHREVLAAQVIFVTLPEFNYAELASLSQKNDQITTALDHLLRDVKMDCASCNLQVICGEVEGLRHHRDGGSVS